MRVILARAAKLKTADEHRAFFRSPRHHGMRRSLREAGADHKAGLGPRIGLLHAQDTRGDFDVPFPRLIDEMKCIGPSPDVGPGALDRLHTLDFSGTARDPDSSNVLALPNGARVRP